jgi:3-oxoacyl-[acyl-carrier protein] reductase
MMSLRGQVAVVTGSTRGIGRGIATRLAREGASVVVNGTRDDDVSNVVSALSAFGGRACGIAADIGQRVGAERLLGLAMETFGRVDLLVNNAAVSGVPAVRPFLELDEEHWDAVLRTNLKGPFLCTSLATRLMVANRVRGCVVNISSFSAQRAHRRMAAYDAAKGGVEAFTRAVALDLAPHGIRVNAVGPGSIDVDESSTGGPGVALERAQTVPLGRLGRVDDIAAAVAFLASAEAAYITGQVLYVDGGMLAQLRAPQVDHA